MYDNTGSFEGNQSFSAISTYVFDADGELDFLWKSYLQVLITIPNLCF